MSATDASRPRRRAPACRLASPGGLVVLTNMQWFYGPTWGRTKRVCEELSRLGRRDGCAKRAELAARQLELVEVLRRNAAHPAVAEVHVLLGEAEPVRRFLSRLPWHERHGCKLRLVETGTRPRFRDYMAHLSGPLLGRVVALTNQDVLLADGDWASVPRALPPNTAYFLSRYHVRLNYDVQHSAAAGAALGLFNASAAREAAGGGRKAVAGLLGGAFDAGAKHARWKRVCDMTAPRFGVWRRSLCTPANFGSYDAYVLRLTTPLSPAELNLFDYPQNAWGGENLFLFLVRHALGMAAANPCLSLQAVHVHCELPTEFGVLKVGDRRLGKKQVVEAARKKLRAMGRHAAADMRDDVGTLKLNVTTLDGSLAGSTRQQLSGRGLSRG